MKKILILFTCLLLSSCMFVHKMDIEQGNIITPQMVQKIHPGMSEADVRNVLGTPVLLNTFNDSRVDYIYTFRAGNQPQTEKYVTLIFRSGILKEISGNMYSPFIK